MKKIVLSSIACATLLLAQSHFVLETQTVTATSLQKDELTYSAPVEIYSTEEIKASRSQDVYEFLNHETSVIALPNAGNPFAQKLDMRGYGITNGYQNIVVVVNGRRLNNTDTVPQLLSSIPLASVDRIEILKGAGAVEFGDGANAGVISITTKNFDGVAFSTYLGSNSTEYGSIGLGYTDSKISISAFADYYETDGARELALPGKKDSGRSKNGAMDAKFYPVDTTELRIGWSATRINTNYAGALTKAEYKDDPTQATTTGYDTNQHFDTDLWSFGGTFDLNDQWSLEANYYTEDKMSDYGSSATKADYDYDSGDIAVKYDTKELRVALGSTFFNGDRSAWGNHTVKDNLSMYLNLDYETGNHTVRLGGRSEKVEYEYFDTTTNLQDDHRLYAYEAGYNYKLDDRQSIFTSFNHAYQAPDIDRFFSYDFWTSQMLFNGFIEPMKSDTYNLGYKRIEQSNILKATIFYADITNEIYFTGGWTGVNTNLDKTSKLGVELYDKYLISDNLYVSANYTYLDAQIEEDDNTAIENKVLPGVSKHNISVSMGYMPTDESKMIVTHTYRSEAYAAEDFENSFDQKQEAYNVTDLSLSYSIGQVEIFGKIQNIFDEDNGLWINDDQIYPVNFERTFTIGLNGNF